MKVLFLGHYREFGGWSQAARNYILAMDSVGIDVVCRDISLTGRQADVPPKILSLENKSTEGCDVCIQNLLPHHLIGTGHFKKNIAILFSESSSIKPLSWFIHLRQMDEVWVPNTDSQRSLCLDNLMPEDRIRVVPCAENLSKYNQQHRPIFIKEIDDKFKFYYVGDLNDRKNIPTIIRAFHSEFDRSEPVSLIIKVQRFGTSPEQLDAAVRGICTQVKDRLRLYKSIESYHLEVIIPEEIDDSGIQSIHDYGDCLVSPSHGEAWSIPAFDAMCFGNTPICSKVGGPKDFIGDSRDIGTLVEGQDTTCVYTEPAFADMFTGRESWFDPNDAEIKNAMRFYYENKDKVDKTAGLKCAQPFSYEVVGQQIKEHLEAQCV